jgi:intracellular sulfur oxidation DsrE/DsrF family protein
LHCDDRTIWQTLPDPDTARLGHPAAASDHGTHTKEERMINLSRNRNDGTPDAAPRRTFFGRVAGAAAVGLAGLVPTLSSTQAEAATNDVPDWPGKLKGRHRQVFDAYSVNDGWPLVFAYTFLETDAPDAAAAVVVLRAGALPIALGNVVWEKYRIGESLKIIDPETKAPAVKNPFLHPKPGVLRADDAAVDRLIARGVVFGACNRALHGMSKMLASNAGASADDAAKEWAANVVPGIAIIPSGVWGLNRAQEGGCTYCTGG